MTAESPKSPRWCPFDERILRIPALLSHGVYLFREDRGRGSRPRYLLAYIGQTGQPFRGRFRHFLHPGAGPTDVKINSFARKHRLEVTVVPHSAPKTEERRRLLEFRARAGRLPRLNSRI